MKADIVNLPVFVYSSIKTDHNTNAASQVLNRERRGNLFWQLLPTDLTAAGRQGLTLPSPQKLKIALPSVKGS